ncbi:DUF4422 domain-containing protein [Zoogloea sp.]|uniref:DUF4422 domain-containing protein n=1 Tax=Zoogloea sp. TaxID=49181 RepID=UPI0035AED055
MNKQNVHIYVCHHKSGYTFSDETFRPIHVGKALSINKLGIPGDDSGDSISAKNKEYCELTALYWAWKNDKTADWIGLVHYRRFMDFSGQKKHIPDVHGCVNFESLDDALTAELGINTASVQALLAGRPELQAILPNKWSVRKAGFRSLHDHYATADHHYVKDLEMTRTVVSELYPDYLASFDAALANHEGYFTNIFVLRKSLFDEYCEWLFNILFEVERRTDLTNYSVAARRIYGYLSERLFNVFMACKRLQPSQYMELERVFVQNTDPLPSITPPSPPPANAVSLVIASDNNFAPHLAALIESIKDNTSTNFFLDLIVLDGGITPQNRNLLKRQFKINLVHQGRLEFVDCTHMYQDIETHMHFSTSTFYRISLGELLPHHRKVIYVDCDMIVLDDLSKLWTLDLEGKAVAAVPDVIMKSFVNFGTPAMREAGGKPSRLYLQEHVGLGNRVDDYFQAGLIVFDLDKYRDMDISDNALSDLLGKKYWFLDQDILNKYLLGCVKFIDTSWNCVNVSGDIIHGLNKEWGTKIAEDLKAPKIVHYAGYEAKPWNNKNAPWASVYWFYLRKTFWYESVTQRFEYAPTLEAAVHRSTSYKLLRAVWRRCPSFVRTLTSGLAHGFVRLSSSR